MYEIKNLKIKLGEYDANMDMNNILNDKVMNSQNTI